MHEYGVPRIRGNKSGQARILPLLGVAEVIASPQAVARQITTEVTSRNGEVAQCTRSSVCGSGDGAPAPVRAVERRAFEEFEPDPFDFP